MHVAFLIKAFIGSPERTSLYLQLLSEVEDSKMTNGQFTCFQTLQKPLFVRIKMTSYI